MIEILAVKSFKKSFNDVNVLKDISFELMEGEVLGVIGPSGSGKTTLLKCLALLEKFDEGVIALSTEEKIFLNEESINDKDIVSSYHKKLGFVFQDFNLWSWMTVLDNLILAPIRVKKIKKHTAILLAKELCMSLGLSDKINTPVWKLSGGQKQRVAIMRALIMEPKILLLDEITSGLDPHLTVSVMQIIRQLRGTGIAMILVTHHIEFATTLCDRIMFLSNGRILQIDTPRILRSMPVSEEVSKFLDIVKLAQ